jgi:hypothetical protein
MKTLLLLTLLLPFVPPVQDGAAPSDGSNVLLLGSKWAKSRVEVSKQEATSNAPAAAMIPANRNFERNRRINDPAGVRDPNADTLDGRSAALEKTVRDARSPGATHIDGYAYRAKVRNAGEKAVEVLFWEYQFTETANPSNVVRRQFLCGVQIKPKKEKELEAVSLSGPSEVVSVGSLAARPGEVYREKVLINRVEYSDGSIWQRKGWSYGEVRAAVARATATPWGGEMCRGL